MTFLDLVVRACEECAVNTDSLSTVVGQRGELKRMVNWVSDAWFKIQGKHQDWRFLRTTASWPTIATQAEYTTLQCGIDAGTFGRWIPDSFRNYLTSSASMAWGDDAWGDSPYDGSSSTGGFSTEIFMAPIPYADWRDLWKFGANRSVTSRPYHLTVLPNDGIGLGPAPLAGYTILGDYYSAPVRLALDVDVPTLPAKHDPMIIVYQAMMSYGAWWKAPEIYGQGKTEYQKLMLALELDQLPQMHFSGALC